MPNIIKYFLNRVTNLEFYQLSKKYKKETETYVKAINAFRADGLKTKWQVISDTKLPVDKRERYAEKMFQIILDANREGCVDQLRDFESFHLKIDMKAF